MRKGITIVAGRMFNPGSNEIVVGKAVDPRVPGLRSRARPSRSAPAAGPWSGCSTPKAAFSSPRSGPTSPSCKACSTATTCSRRRGVRLQSPAALAALKGLCRQRSAPEARRQIGSRLFRRAGRADHRLDPEARLAARHRDGVRRARRRAQYDVLVGRGAGDRDRDPAGDRLSAPFRPSSGTLLESLLLAVIGGVVGAAATWLIFDGLSPPRRSAQASRRSSSTSSSAPALIWQGIVLALIVGLVGGLFPAIRAARMPIVAGLSG